MEITSAHIVAAREGAEQFETQTRANGERFISLPFEAPSWLSDVVRDAHGASMLPDDYKYRFVSEAFDRLADASIGDDTDEMSHEFADDVDVYTSELVKWLGSHCERLGYCDDAVSDGLIDASADISQRMMVGQYNERREVFDTVANAVETRAETILEDWETEARELGAEHARNAASWTCDGNTDPEGARKVLALIEDGDPMADDYLPRRPNLSGEFAEDSTPQGLAWVITGEDECDAETIDALASAYEDGVGETFENACVSELRKVSE